MKKSVGNFSGEISGGVSGVLFEEILGELSGAIFSRILEAFALEVPEIFFKEN